MIARLSGWIRFFTIALAIAVLVPVIYWWVRGAPPLPVYGDLPAFSLTDSRGKAFSRDSLLGKVWVADLIYTRCEDTCPAQAADMARLQKLFAQEADFALLSVTVDPDNDTPAVLARYAAAFAAKAGRWVFLTGDKKSIDRLAREGFRLAYATRQARRGIPGLLLSLLSPPDARAHHPQGGPGSRISHSSRFVLLDRSARIRGYYLTGEAEALERLRGDIRLLLRENR